MNLDGWKGVVFWFTVCLSLFLIAGCIFPPVTPTPEPNTGAGWTKYSLGNQTFVLNSGQQNITVQLLNKVESQTFKDCGLIECNVDLRLSAKKAVGIDGSTGLTGRVTKTLGVKPASLKEILVLNDSNFTEFYWGNIPWNWTIYDSNTSTWNNFSGTKDELLSRSQYQKSWVPIVFPLSLNAGKNYSFRLVFARKASKIGEAADDLVFGVVGNEFPEFAWWNATFAHKKMLNITNGIANYQIKLQVNTSGLITNNSLQTDCEDVWFVNSTENGAVPMWFETQLGVTECNTQNTTIWTKPAESGNYTMYMYYNDSTTSNNSNGSAVALNAACFDDFLGTSLSSSWSKVGTVGHSVAGGVVTLGGSGSAAWTFLSLNNTCNFTYQGMMIIFGKQNTSNDDNWNGYKISNNPGLPDVGQARWMGHRITLNKMTTRVDAGPESNGAYSTNTSYHWLEIARINSSFTRFWYTNTTLGLRNNSGNFTTNIFPQSGFPQISTVQPANWLTADWVMVVNYTDINAPTYVFGDEMNNSAGTVSANLSVYGADATWVQIDSRKLRFRCSATQTYCEPVNQTASESKCALRVCNNGTAGGTVGVYFNLSVAPPTGITMFVRNSSSLVDTITLSTANKSIWNGSIAAGGCQDFCAWANYSNPSPPFTFPQILAGLN